MIEESSPEPTVALSVRALCKTYGGVRVLGPVDVTFRAGTIHALLGGNGSGKSTFIKTLAGIVPADHGGTLHRNGREIAAADLSPAAARELGMHFVHQDPGLFPGMSVADNLAADGPYPSRLSSVNGKELKRRAAQALARFDLDIDPAQSIDTLSAANRTMIGIARALRGSDQSTSSVLVLDEPTASLPAHEVHEVLDVLRRLADEGQAIIYVTHHLDEVVAVADECTVLRDGAVAAHMTGADITRPALVTAIVGRPTTTDGQLSLDRVTVENRLEINGLRSGRVGPVSFTVGGGEIIGIAGLLGSGRSTILRALFGAHPRNSGRVTFDGTALDPGTIADAIRAGIAYVPEDRAADAAFLDQDIADNISASISSTRRRLFVSPRSVRRAGTDAIAEYGIKARSAGQLMTRLSGGNQQKVVMARWLRESPRLLLLDEPSQGVDIGARAELHQLIIRHARSSRAVVLVVSSSDEELAELCDRVLLLKDGQLAGELTGKALTASKIAHAVLTGTTDSLEGAA